MRYIRLQNPAFTGTVHPFAEHLHCHLPCGTSACRALVVVARYIRLQNTCITITRYIRFPKTSAFASHARYIRLQNTCICDLCIGGLHFQWGYGQIHCSLSFTSLRSAQAWIKRASHFNNVTTVTLPNGGRCHKRPKLTKGKDCSCL